MNLFSKDKRKENKKQHEEFRYYYWHKQMDVIFRISIVFLIFCAVGFVFLVPIEHVKYPDLGRLKYGVAVVGHVLAAIFAKWLICTKKVSLDKKPIVSESVPTPKC